MHVKATFLFQNLKYIPCLIGEDLEGLLVGDLHMEHKIHLAIWPTVCNPIHQGVLGIRKLLSFNQPLLWKYLWRYGLEWDSLWQKVIDRKYSTNRCEWHSRVVKGAYGMGLWKHIRKGWDNFASHTWYEVGDEWWLPRIFWRNHWGESGNFQDRYPEFLRFARDKNELFADYLEWVHGKVHWNNSLRGTRMGIGVYGSILGWLVCCTGYSYWSW